MKFRPTPPEIRELIAPALARTRAINIERHMHTIQLFREVDREISAPLIDFFLHAANNEGRCLSEVAVLASLKQATASRYFSKLSTFTYRGKKGLGLLRSIRNPFNQRQRLILLTSLGESLLDCVD